MYEVIEHSEYFRLYTPKALFKSRYLLLCKLWIWWTRFWWEPGPLAIFTHTIQKSS